MYVQGKDNYRSTRLLALRLPAMSTVTGLATISIHTWYNVTGVFTGSGHSVLFFGRNKYNINFRVVTGQKLDSKIKQI
jgi:hypothetical protein